MKKNHFFALMFAVVTMAVMVGCEKEPLPDEPDVDASLPKVLLAGNDLVGTQATGAVCWEDGNKSSLSTSVDDYATGAFGYGNDTYYVGQKDGKPVVWKNGVAQFLSQSPGCANDIFVSSRKVYIVGKINSAATLWVDGTPQSLEDKYYEEHPWVTPSNEAYGITVANGKVYIVGAGRVPCLWVDGECQLLSDLDGTARDVAVDGSTVYVVGELLTEDCPLEGIHVPVLWTNGTVQDLTPANEAKLPGTATGVCVYNHTPYISFYRGKGDYYVYTRYGYIYQNGTSRQLDCTYANDVAVKDGNVYVAGSKTNSAYDTQYTVLFKNNERQSIGSSSSPADIHGIYLR